MNKYLIKLEQLYIRLSKQLEMVVFPIILLLWPLIKVNQGIDVSDSTYSLGNYLFADKLSGVWVISTYVSNLIGAVLVRLPGGNTLRGINIYTGLILSAIALTCYYTLKNDFTAPVLFFGEFVAISFCWIPTGILYNYLTYYLFTVSAILIFKAIRNEDNKLYFLAGIVLGINVFVRIPNIAEVAIILVVWAITISFNLPERRNNALISSTVNCIIGYVIGVGIPLILIIANYGLEGITDMMTGLSDMSSSNSEYTLTAMILMTLRAYFRSAKWMLIIVAVTLAGTLMIATVKKNAVLKNIGRVSYVITIAVMIRFFWGRGMFSFRYYEDYTSMFEWGMIALFLAWITTIVVLIKKNYNILLKTYAWIVLIMLVITPLGSNNYTCQNLNNMFLIMPFIIYVIGGWIHKGAHRIRLEGVFYGTNFPWMSMLIILLVVIAVQTTLFHVNFIFRDGMDGTRRDIKITGDKVLNGMYTNANNAEEILGLINYAQGTDIESAIYWGDCPGLAFVLGIPPTISTTWPDLDSYSINRFDSDLLEASVIDMKNAVVMKKQDKPSYNLGNQKLDILNDYIASKHMNIAYENNGYIVYR